jgi:uncharacterized protein YdeI (YjbR/CyaY-like superfamily)
MKPTFFKTPAAWRTWLEEHHADRTELWVGFYKKGSGRPSITWPESVDGALCFGWIDGVRKSLDDERYVIRFTPRRQGSVWSAVNIRRMAELEKLGLVSAAGKQAFERRRDDRSAIYSYEQRKAAALTPAQQAQLEANGPAWAFFSAQAPWYRRVVAHWVTSAKKVETQQKRLARLIEDSAAGRRIAPILGPPSPAAGKRPARPAARPAARRRPVGPRA